MHNYGFNNYGGSNVKEKGKKDKGTTFKKKEKCVGHELPVLIADGVVPFYAGNKNTKKVPVGATLIDLVGGITPPVRCQGIQIPSLQSRSIIFDWPDMGTPALEQKHWRALADALRAQKAPVFVGCMGGHGRTGTAVAILAHFLKIMPKGEDPVLWVRDHYCPEAVETDGQVKYVSDMTGRPSTAKGNGFGGGKWTGGSASTLCNVKPNGQDWCNLDDGHFGDHDMRPRHDLLKDRHGDGKPRTNTTIDAEKLATMELALGLTSSADNGASVVTVKDLPPTVAPAKFCMKNAHCLLAEGHQGKCKSRWSGQYI